MVKVKSARNKTIELSESEKKRFAKKIIVLPKNNARNGVAKQAFKSGERSKVFTKREVTNKIFCADLFSAIEMFPPSFVDLMIIDPPYNLSKNFGGKKFRATDDVSYEEYLESWFPHVIRLLKKDASVYVCCDWKCSASVYNVLKKYLIVRNRITWQREKGRSAKANWKNASEDIYFATVSEKYFFNNEAVKQKRRVLAPYRENGKAKDWSETKNGKFRLTGASNFWDDITIPYWSMSENTEHPTQKSEKLFAKIILASSKKGDFVFDPFSGSGTTCVVAKKLERYYAGIEVNEKYCLLAEKRLETAENDKSIQGFKDGIFWERNSGR